MNTQDQRKLISQLRTLHAVTTVLARWLDPSHSPATICGCLSCEEMSVAKSIRLYLFLRCWLNHPLGLSSTGSFSNILIIICRTQRWQFHRETDVHGSGLGSISQMITLWGVYRQLHYQFFLIKLKNVCECFQYTLQIPTFPWIELQFG